MYRKLIIYIFHVNQIFLLSNSEIEKTISWLSQQAAQRYYSMCGLRPLLTLSTKDGAFLSNNDQIFQVLSSNEEVCSSGSLYSRYIESNSEGVQDREISDTRG